VSLEELIKKNVPIEAGPRQEGERIVDGRIKGSIGIHLDVKRTGDDAIDAMALRGNAIRHLLYGLKELGYELEKR